MRGASVQVLRANSGKTFGFSCLLVIRQGWTLAGSPLRPGCRLCRLRFRGGRAMALGRLRPLGRRTASRRATARELTDSPEKPPEGARRACLTPWKNAGRRIKVRNWLVHSGRTSKRRVSYFYRSSRRPGAALPGLVPWCTDFATKFSCPQ